MIGKLNQRVTIFEKRQVRKPNGVLDVQLVPRVKVWAQVRPKSGRERDHAQQTENPADYEFAIRNSTKAQAIKPDDVLEWFGRRMNITWVGYRGRQHQYLHIDARDGVAV